MTYQMVMLDIDGTLVDERQQVSARVKTAIRRVQARGIPVGLCTGRLARTCYRLVEELHLDHYSIYYSGTLLKNLLTGQVLQKHPFSPQIARQLIRLAREQHLFLELHTEEAYYYELPDSYSEFQHALLGIAPVATDLLEIITHTEVLKLQFVTAGPEEFAHLLRFQREHGQVALSSGRAPGHPHMLFTNVIPAGISKGSGLREVAGSARIPLEQVLVIGDSTGDIDAMRVAGLGVAMGNAEEEVKQAADYVTASVAEDGVALALEHFILNR
jgi:Cof subfamily protein (haloacid dehalogenase superfamily)